MEYRARVEHLIAMLQEVHAKQKNFAIEAWAFPIPDVAVCKTTFCAGGYAACDPVFNSLGLHWAVWNDGVTTKLTPIALADLPKVLSENLEVEYTDPSDDDVRPRGAGAMAAVLGIPHETSEYLFWGTEYWEVAMEGRAVTALDVVERLKEVLANNGTHSAAYASRWPT